MDLCPRKKRWVDTDVRDLLLTDLIEPSTHQNTVLYHLREKFDLESVAQTGNTLLWTDVLDFLPGQVEVGHDLHLRSYYDDEDEIDGLYSGIIDDRAQVGRPWI